MRPKRRTTPAPGGTSSLDLGESNSGTATLKAFDPGAFVRATSQEENAPADGDLLGSAQFDDGSGSHPSPDETLLPPPDETLLPPPDETHLLSPDGTLLPPPDRTHLPPPDGTLPPPPDGGFFFMPPDGFTGELPPPLVLPFDFEGVLETSGTE